jgi:hypothetical protein
MSLLYYFLALERPYTSILFQSILGQIKRNDVYIACIPYLDKFYGRLPEMCAVLRVYLVCLNNNIHYSRIYASSVVGTK